MSLDDRCFLSGFGGELSVEFLAMLVVPRQDGVNFADGPLRVLLDNLLCGQALAIQ